MYNPHHIFTEANKGKGIEQREKLCERDVKTLFYIEVNNGTEEIYCSRTSHEKGGGGETIKY